MKHVQRAQIILLSAERLPVLEIAKRVGISRPMAWRWQQRFAEEGIEGLLRDKTRPPGIRQCRRPRCMPSSSAPCATARCSHPLDRPRHGQGDGSFAANDPAHMGRP